MAKKKMSMYDHLQRNDIITKLTPEFDNGSFFLHDDGRITRTTRISHNSPWIHVKLAPNRHCGLYHTYFNRFGFIHSTCQECWKVVVRPKSLRQLHQLLNMQEAMNFPSKCGIEKRETVHGLYGGYFYNDSKKQGLDCYRIVRQNVDVNLTADVTVILKRGCTEFELGIGPSDTWVVSKEQKEKEYQLLDMVDQDNPKMGQPQHLKDTIFRSWIHWAYANGDPTYLEYVGHPLFKPLVTYHQETKDARRPKKTGTLHPRSAERDDKSESVVSAPKKKTTSTRDNSNRRKQRSKSRSGN